MVSQSPLPLSQNVVCLTVELLPKLAFTSYTGHEDVSKTESWQKYVINLCDVFAVDHGSFPTSLFAVATGEIDSSLLSAQQGSW